MKYNILWTSLIFISSLLQYLHDEGWKKRQFVFSYIYLPMLK